MSETTNEVKNEPTGAIDTTDRRKIEEMQFGMEAGRDLPEEERKALQESVRAKVREFLLEAGCSIADDINRLGCTGAFGYLLMKSQHVTDAPIPFLGQLRLDMAGGGVGLPCFVPPTRYCLVHNTIGGLEDKQKAYHEEYVSSISRELTAAEREKVRAMKHVTSMRSAEQIEEFFQSGKSAAEAEDAATMGPVAEAEAEAFPVPQALSQGWQCPEHNQKVNWGCRYCVASAIVEGSLAPVYGYSSGVQALLLNPIEPSAIDTTIPSLNSDRVELYVRIATFTRKLSRD